MPKRIAPLSERKIKQLSTQPGLHNVGGVSGLYLCVKNDNSRSWILRVSSPTTRHDVGLGPYPDVTSAAAREKARQTTDIIKKEGIEGVIKYKPKSERPTQCHDTRPTILDLTDQYLAKKRNEWTGKDIEKRVRKHRAMLETYVLPTIGHLRTDQITIKHVTDILDPIWESKTHTADRVRLHMEKIIAMAMVMGLRTDHNPARWAGYLDQIYPAPSKVSPTEHHKSLNYKKIPGFIAKLDQIDTIAARALELSILTATRPGEARDASWSEFDFENAVWNVPKKRTKLRRDHVIPMSEAVIHTLNRTPRTNEWVFHVRGAQSISDITVNKLKDRLEDNITVHGFRSTFKEWARAETSFPDEVSELALAHVGSDATRAAYARDSLLDQRRLMMDAWAKYCYSDE